MTTAVIYTRFSPRPNAKECDSCEKQLERCEKFCLNKGYFQPCIKPMGSMNDPFTDAWKGIFQDRNTTGGELDRPQLSAAIECLTAIEGDKVLVVDSADRLARDMLVALTIRHEVEKAGARIEYANGTTPTETPEGKLFGNILAAFAAYERDRVKFATSRGIKRRQENGEWFGKPPVGWMRDPEDSKKLIPCQEEQQAIERAKYLNKNGWFSDSIAKILSAEFGPFRGKPWSPRTVRKIIAGECKLAD